MWIQATDTPLFVSHSRLRGRTPEGLPRADRNRWVLDSGAFSFITWFGAFPDDPRDYARRVRLYDAVIGGLEWAAIQDWMCEPDSLAVTGLSVAEHQRRTVASYLDLTAAWEAMSTHRPDSPFMPGLQGWTPADYVRCVRMYQAAGVDLAAAPVVGLGSVCKREDTEEIAEVVATVRAEVPGIRLHGFGVKTGGLARYGAELHSCDSMAWSYAAWKRRIKSARCTQFHRVCSSCLIAAEDWHAKVWPEFVAARADAAPATSPVEFRADPAGQFLLIS
nr:hypothetical protein [Actinokineospora terrae]